MKICGNLPLYLNALYEHVSSSSPSRPAAAPVVERGALFPPSAVVLLLVPRFRRRGRRALLVRDVLPDELVLAPGKPMLLRMASPEVVHDGRGRGSPASSASAGLVVVVVVVPELEGGGGLGVAAENVHVLHRLPRVHQQGAEIESEPGFETRREARKADVPGARD